MASANTERAGIELTAIDNGASRVLANVKGGADDVAKSADAIRSAWSSGIFDSFTKGPALAAVGILGGLAAGAVGAGAYFYTLARAAAEGQAALKSFAEVTGATVEGASAIRTVLKLTGGDMGALEGAFTKLAKNISTGGEDVQRALNAIGLSQKALQGLSTDQQFLKIANALEGYRDGAEKTALAQILMGKSGAQMLPVMRDIIEAGDLVTKVTAQQAREADDLEKGIKRLTVTQDAWKKTIGNALVPVLGDVVTILVKVQNEAGGLNKTTKELSADGTLRRWAENSVLAVAALIDVIMAAWGVVKAFGAGIAGILAGSTTVLAGIAESSIAIIKGEYAKLPGIVKGTSAGIVEITKAVGTDIVQNLVGNGDNFYNKFKKQFADSAQSAKDFAENMRYTGDSSKKAIGDISKPAEEAKEKINAMGKALDELLNKLNNPDVDTGLRKEFELLTKAFQVGALSAPKYAAALVQATVQSKTFSEGQKAIADSLKVNEDLLEKNREAVEAVARSMAEGNRTLSDEIATIGMSSVERARYNLELQRTNELFRINQTLTGTEQSAAVNRLNALVDQRIELLNTKDALEQQQSAWASLQGVTENFFSDLLQNGRSAFGNLWNTIKKFFADTIAKFATKLVLNAVLNLGGEGGGVGSLLSSLLGGGSSGGGGAASGVLGSALGSLGTLGGVIGMGGSGVLGALGAGYSLGAAGAGAAGLAGAGGAFGIATSAGGIAGVAGGIGSIVGSVLAMIPVVGWIALAAAAAYALFGKDEKGIKFDNSLRNIAAAPRNVQVSALGNFAPSGDVDDKMLSTLQPFLDKVKTMDDYIAKNLLSDASLATVREKIQALTNPRWWNLDDKDATAKASIYFLKQRFTVAFNEIESGVGDMINAFTGTGDELVAYIDKLSQTAYVVKSLNDELPGMNLSIKGFLGMSDAAQQAFLGLAAAMGTWESNTNATVAAMITKSNQGVIGAYNDQIDIVLKLKAGLATGATTMEQFAAGVGSVATAYAAATAKLVEVKTALAGLFSDSRDVYATGGMSNEEKYNFYQGRAQADYDQLTRATSIEQIDQLTRRIDNYQRSAFGLLTPEQQREARGEFGAASGRVETTANDRIDAVGTALDKQNAAIKTAIKEGLAEYAAAAKDAADKQVAAADKQVDAANTRREIDINFTANVPGVLQTTEVGG